MLTPGATGRLATGGTGGMGSGEADGMTTGAAVGPTTGRGDDAASGPDVLTATNWVGTLCRTSGWPGTRVVAVMYAVVVPSWEPEGGLGPGEPLLEPPLLEPPLLEPPLLEPPLLEPPLLEELGGGGKLFVLKVSRVVNVGDELGVPALALGAGHALSPPLPGGGLPRMHA
jgi:hypothetical protein